MCAEPSPGLGLCWEVKLDRNLQTLAGRRLEKGGENGFTTEILPVFPMPYSSFSKYVCHSSYKYSSSALSTLSLISYPFIFSPFLYSLSFFPHYLQKFMRKFHSSITLLMFSLYTHSPCFFPVLHALASPICLTVEK